MNLEEILKEIVEIIEERNKARKESQVKGWYDHTRKYSKSRLRRLRLLLNEMIKKEEDEFYEI